MMSLESLCELGGQLASGGAASALAKTAVAPFERVKILMQTSSLEGCRPAGHRRFAGVLDALARIPREQGPTSFWRGNATNCSRVIPTYALRFTLFGRFRELVSAGYEPAQPLPLSRQMAAGALSGGTTMLATFPLDLLRTRMSADLTAAGQPRAYRSLPAAARAVVRAQGVPGLYQGLVRPDSLLEAEKSRRG